METSLVAPNLEEGYEIVPLVGFVAFGSLKAFAFLDFLRGQGKRLCSRTYEGMEMEIKKIKKKLFKVLKRKSPFTSQKNKKVNMSLCFRYDMQFLVPQNSFCYARGTPP